MNTPPITPTASGSQPSSATSRSLLERVRANDTGAWDRLLRLYAPLVVHWCRRAGLSEADIADVFQEVFLAVATHVHNFRKERAADTFRGWLRTITQSKLSDHFRKRAHEPDALGGTDALTRMNEVPDLQPADDASVADECAEGRLFQRGLDLIRNEFEERTWQAFWRMAVAGRTASEVAAELSMSPGAVRMAKLRVLKRLREELGDLPE
jgi:RNA polymerase sigma-70 factor, ECF subfamily